MYFENIDTSINNEEYYDPLRVKAKELKKEKENLEEYFKQLVFIKKMLEHILIEYSNKERNTFSLEVNKDWFDKYIIEALNVLLKDVPSHNNSFSKTEIDIYIKRLEQEIHYTNYRIDRIISQLNRYQGVIS